MENNIPNEQDPAVKLHIMKSQAVRQAMFEVIGEQRLEIIKRARAKLVAMGVEITDEEITAAVSPP
jgi:hypothetical protein